MDDPVLFAIVMLVYVDYLINYLRTNSVICYALLIQLMGDGSCFRPVARLTDDVKDKLLTYLFDRLRTTLAATGCPISDVRIHQI